MASAEYIVTADISAHVWGNKADISSPVWGTTTKMHSAPVWDIDNTILPLGEELQVTVSDHTEAVNSQVKQDSWIQRVVFLENELSAWIQRYKEV